MVDNKNTKQGCRVIICFTGRTTEYSRDLKNNSYAILKNHNHYYNINQ